jgi:uncharacterized protein
MTPLRAHDETRGVVVATRVEVARSFGARLRGLLGRSSLEAGEGLVIDPCSSIHTFFMRFPIDVVFLGDDDRVVAIIPDLRPWRATRFYAAARSTLELSAGTAARTGMAVGDRIVLVSDGSSQSAPQGAGRP